LRLAALLGRARLAAAGTVTRVDEYDHGRVTVGRVRPDRVLKGEPGPGELAIVEEHDRPSSVALLRAGARVVVLLERAPHTSALAGALPPGPTYLRLLDGAAGFIGDAPAPDVDEAAALLARMVEASADVTTDAGPRAARARTLVFDEIAARHPRLVADGAAALTPVPDLATTLADDERSRLTAALQRHDLPSWVRIALVDAVAAARLVALAPVLRTLEAPKPEVLAASWDALRRLGAPVGPDDLASYGASPDPAIRAIVPTALLGAAGDDAIPAVERMSLSDADPAVRRAAVDALGATKRPSVVPSLERAFRAGPAEMRQAAGRGFLAVGGRPAAESLAHLAYEPPPDAEHYAITLLLALVPKDDALVERIRTSHPDPDIRDFVEHGPYLGHHHD
jgi:HEAT repeat protein